MFTPFLRLLHDQMPDHQIDFFIFQKNALLPIVKSHFYNKAYISDPGFLSLLRILYQLKKNKYDIIFQTSGTSPLKIFLFTLLLGHHKCFGEFRRFKNPFFKNQVLFDSTIHRFDSNRKILSLFIDSNAVQRKPEFFLDQDDDNFAIEFIQKNGLEDKTLFGIHPGCNKKSINRRWPKENFVKVIDFLKKNYPDIIPVQFIGPDELMEGEYIKNQTGVLTVSQTNLFQSAALIRQCRYFLNTDSGLGHIASCFNVQIFTIFGPADPRLSAPLSEKAVIIQSNISCQPCEQLNPQNCQIECLQQLKAEKVIEIIKTTIGEIKC